MDETIKTYEKAASFDTYDDDVTLGLIFALRDIRQTSAFILFFVNKLISFVEVIYI